jgi:hypothetical protein
MFLSCQTTFPTERNTWNMLPEVPFHSYARSEGAAEDYSCDRSIFQLLQATFWYLCRFLRSILLHITLQEADDGRNAPLPLFTQGEHSLGLKYNFVKSISRDNRKSLEEGSYPGRREGKAAQQSTWTFRGWMKIALALCSCRGLWSRTCNYI